MRAFDDVIERLAQQARDGDRATILWDVDGTLLDTRPRMLATVHAFGRRDVQLGDILDIAYTWQATAARLRLPREQFRAFWDAHYWDERSFAHDVPIALTLERARRAQALGIANIALTGRTWHRQSVTFDQLAQHGLGDVAGVVVKPSMATPTVAWKAAASIELAEQGFRIGAFVSDSREELDAVGAAVAAVGAAIACVHVSCDAGCAGGCDVDVDVRSSWAEPSAPPLARAGRRALRSPGERAAPRTASPARRRSR